MSDTIRMAVPRPPFEGGLSRRVRVSVVVAIARVLARSSPRRLAQVLSAVARSCGPAEQSHVEVVRRQVEAVSVLCAGEGCLPRSIAIALLCASDSRAWPSWRTGVRVEPFRAHAWVECDGVATGEEPDFDAGQFLITMEVMAGGAQR